MPTYLLSTRFARELAALTPKQRRALERAVAKFIAGLRSGDMPNGLRIKRVQGSPGVFEMTFAPDGRATFSFGEPVLKGQPHVIWRRVGTHDIFGAP